MMMIKLLVGKMMELMCTVTRMLSARLFCCSLIRQHFFDCVNNFYHLKFSKTYP